MVDFIETHREVYGVEPICAELPSAPSTYYEYKARQTDANWIPARIRRNEELEIDVQRVWEDTFQVYGAHKVWRELRRESISATRCKVELNCPFVIGPDPVLGFLDRGGNHEEKAIHRGTDHPDPAGCRRPLHRALRTGSGDSSPLSGHNQLWVPDLTYVAN